VIIKLPTVSPLIASAEAAQEHELLFSSLPAQSSQVYKPVQLKKNAILRKSLTILRRREESEWVTFGVVTRLGYA
jgi:hypothetical protein